VNITQALKGYMEKNEKQQVKVIITSEKRDELIARVIAFSTHYDSKEIQYLSQQG
jgi:hypothetical protein